MKNIYTLTVFCLFVSILTHGQSTDSTSNPRVFTLGEVKVVSENKTETVSPLSKEIYMSGNVSDAASTLPGIHLANFGNKGEASVYIRGFDIRSVPVFLDGIPVSMPYDGYLDLGRLLEDNIEEISISKGFIPVGFGGGGLGGAINLLTLKPSEKFEFSAKALYGTGNLRSTFVRIGSKLDKVYINGNVHIRKQDFFPLSVSFDTASVLGSEDGGKRDNSWLNDLNANFKIGFTPNQSDEYSLSYSYLKSSKGIPPYAGRDTRQRERFWQWPEWKKNSLYFIAKKRTGQYSFIKLRAFYDDFSNELTSYDDNSYTTTFRGYSFTSFYNDYSLGSNVEYSYSKSSANSIKFTAYYKDENHSEHNDGEPIRNFKDANFSTGIEDSYAVNNKLKIIGNLAYIGRVSRIAEDYNAADSSISNFPQNGDGGTTVQMGMNYKISSMQSINLAVARRIRMASMKEKYSYRTGSGIPNPHLKAEKGTQIEFAYERRMADKLTINATVFYTYLNDAIITVFDTTSGLIQARNTGMASNHGFELSGNMKLSRSVYFLANYTYMVWNNITEPDVNFINIPKHDVYASFQFRASKNLEFITDLRYMSDRVSTSYGTVAENFITFNLIGKYTFYKLAFIKLGMNNIFDKAYELTEGFPDAGRMIYLTLGLDY